MPLVFRDRLAAAAVALALAGAQATSQDAQRQPRATSQPHQTPAGLPLYSSDGRKLGKVIATGLDSDDEPVLVAEIERPLGIGPQTIAIPTNMFVPRRDRIELTITEAEVNARLGGTGR
ncbi:MAG: PRC-barrel domain-containing protein [Hyphomicrobiaceae bacterium]|nr:PRC-barrel domain-containing protein [Hyphomicrobiaceae bacterium]